MIGQTLSHFKIIAKLGEGGMGEVYRAEDSKLGRDVAIKVLPAEVADDPQRLERFEREAKAVAALNHPNIVTVYSVEEADGIHFMAMELVKAFVALKDGYEPDDNLRRELIRFGRQKLGAGIAPREIEFVASLPKTRSGKIMRRLLKARELGLPEGDTSTLEDD